MIKNQTSVASEFLLQIIMKHLFQSSAVFFMLIYGIKFTNIRNRFITDRN